MKVLVAVLSTRTPPWGQMIATSKATWDSVDVPDVETVYYVAEPESPLEDRVVGFQVRESYATMGHKNLMAWRWMLEHSDFDFMARVNASCYVHKARLLEHCRSFPTSGVIAGGQVLSHNGEPPWLWGGHQMILSRDVVQAFVDQPEKWPHHEMEDVAMSHGAVALGYNLVSDSVACAIDRMGPEEWRVVSSNGNSFHFTYWADVAKLDTQVFFRVKQDQRRDEDTMIMKELFKNLIP